MKKHKSAKIRTSGAPAGRTSKQGGLRNKSVPVSNRPKVGMAKGVGPTHGGPGFGRQSPKIMLPIRRAM